MRDSCEEIFLSSRWKMRITFSEPVHDTKCNIDNSKCAKHVLDSRHEHGRRYEMTITLESITAYLQCILMIILYKN